MSVNLLKNGVFNASGQDIGSNIVINSDFSQTYQQTTGWDTSKNGTTLASSWGGYNSGVSNPGTVYHAHMVQFQGEWVYVYIRTSAESWLGVSQGGLQSYISPNTTYTWSIDEYRTSGSDNYITAGVYYKKTSDGSYGFHSGVSHGTGENLGGDSEFDRWVRRYYTFTTGEVYTSNNISFYIYGNSGGNGTVYMRRPKLEKGSVATPWTKAVRENYDITYNGFMEYETTRPKIRKNIVEANNFYEF